LSGIKAAIFRPTTLRNLAANRLQKNIWRQEFIHLHTGIGHVSKKDKRHCIYSKPKI